MGYPTIGKVKTIVLTFDLEDDDGISLDEYKQKYGIDIKEVFGLNSNNYFDKKDFKDTSFYIECSKFVLVDDNAGVGTKVIIPSLVYNDDDYSGIKIEYRNIIYFGDEDTSTDIVCLSILLTYEGISIEINKKEIQFAE